MVAGIDKARPLLAALRAGVATDLVVDEDCGLAVNGVGAGLGSRTVEVLGVGTVELVSAIVAKVPSG